MRLFVLTTSFPSQANTNSGIFIQYLLAELPANIDTTVLSPACKHAIADLSRSGNTQCRQFRYALRQWQILAHEPGGIPVSLSENYWAWLLIPFFSASMFFYTMIFARKADIIHAHWSFSGLIGGIMGRLYSLPSIVTLRGSDVRWAEKNVVFRKIIQWCIKLNTRVVTVGEDLADQVRQWVPAGRKRVLVIPNGVDERFWLIQKNFTSAQNVTVIGNLIGPKNIDVVIRAFESIISRNDQLRLVIVGAGPEMSRLRSLTHRLLTENRVVFTGQLAPNQVTDRLAQSRLLVMASESEGRPNVVLEAMAAGVPVVASDIGGVRELLGNSERGLLFPVGDVDQLAECMMRVLDDPDLGRRLAERASRWIQDQGLTWERTAQKYAGLYRQVIAEHCHKSGKRTCAG